MRTLPATMIRLLAPRSRHCSQNASLGMPSVAPRRDPRSREEDRKKLRSSPTAEMFEEALTIEEATGADRDL